MSAEGGSTGNGKGGRALGLSHFERGRMDVCRVFGRVVAAVPGEGLSCSLLPGIGQWEIVHLNIGDMLMKSKLGFSFPCLTVLLGAALLCRSVAWFWLLRCCVWSLLERG